MKKIRFMVAICAALMIAAPAMALEVEVSGHYFIEYFNNSNPNLKDSDATDDYLTMEFMAKPVFKVNDNITLTTQFTALQDHVWGTRANSPDDEAASNPLAPEMDNNENFDWKAAYLTIKTPIGGFIAGRYIDSAWGTGLGDTTASHGSNSFHKDRLMWVVPVGDFISGLVAQKNREGDKGTLVSDQDFTKYYAFSAYRKENWSTGLLFSYYDIGDFVTQKELRRFQSGFVNFNQLSAAATTARGQYTGSYNQLLQLVPPALAPAVQAAPFDPAAAAAVAAGTGTGINLYDLNSAALSAEGAAAAQGVQIQNGPERTDANIFLLDPYFKGTFGPFSVEAELIYGWGKIDLNANEIDPVSGEVFDSLDASAWLGTVDLKYDIAGFTFNGGYTYVQGDSDYTDSETSAAGYLERSNDLEHGFLLTSDVSNLQTSLGGTDSRGIPLGNVAGGNMTLTGTAGYQAFWLGAKYRLLDNLNLGFLYVNSKADDAPYYNLDPAAGPINKTQWDDDHGSEYDFTLEWDMMSNLKFWGVVAYLDAGDYWKQDNPNADIEDNLTFYARMTLEF